jgi:hypothetical protein
MRSFHATKADGRESLCDSLGFTKKEVDVCYFYIYIHFTCRFPLWIRCKNLLDCCKIIAGY